MIKLNILREDSIDDILEPKSYRIPNVWEDWKFDVAQAAKRFGLTLDNLDYDSDSMTIIVTVDGYDRLGYEKYRRLYNWVVENVYPEQNSYNVEESKQLKRRSKSLIEKPVATSTKTTGYTERAIAIPKYKYSDIWEDGLEELLYDCKDVDDRVEWDIDYHGGMFGDTETLYLYSSGDTYEEVKYFIQQWRDKVMYESMKRRATKTVKEDSFDDVGFDYKIRYISNFQQDALYDLVDYLVNIGAISGPEDKRIDIIEEPQLDSVQIKLLSDFKTYKKALDWIKNNDAYFYESKMTRRFGKKLHEQDVEIDEISESTIHNVGYYRGNPEDDHYTIQTPNKLYYYNKVIGNKIVKWRTLDDCIDALLELNEVNMLEDILKKKITIERVNGQNYVLEEFSPEEVYDLANKFIRNNLSDSLIADYFDESVLSKQFRKNTLKEQDVEIEVKHEGILEVPEGKNVEDLPMSHFEKLVKKNGLGKVNKALNNLQVWNKNKNKKLSKWAGDMIDKLNKKFEKSEGVYRKRRTVSKSSRINESFSEIEIINLIKQKYGQSGVDAFYKAEELYNEYPDTFNTELIVLPSEPSVLNSTRMTRRNKSGKTVDSCFSEIMNGNIECLPKLIQVFYDLADLPQFRKFLRDNT